jgi:hypothetical protein
VTKAGLALSTIPPTVNCPQQSEFFFNTDLGKASAIASWPFISATDPVGITSTQYITNPTGLYLGAAFPVGNSSVRYVAINAAGLFSECNFVVIVLDREAPKVFCPNSFSQYCNPPFRYASVSWIIPSFTDNVGILSSSISRSPGIYDAGTYSVDAVAIDAVGNLANCSFTFTVITFTTPPNVDCPMSQTVSTAPKKSLAIVDWPTPNITSQTGIASAIYNPSQYFPPAAFSLGTTSVTYTVTDLFLNVRVCSFKIVVLDKEPPSITCPLPFTVQISVGETTVRVNWQSPIIYDNVAIDTITQSLSPLELREAGNFTVVAYCNDTSGNISPPCLFKFYLLIKKNSFLFRSLYLF